MELLINASLPNLFILGAAKCGTTSLAHLLSQHPDVFVPKLKECDFFDYDAAYSKGIDFYVHSYFKNTGCYKVRCDATPFYLPFKKVPERIKAAYGAAANNLKFIVMVRDPVERAWSHYLHCCRNGVENLSFEAALDAEDDRLSLCPECWRGYARDGRYGEQLAFWFTSFRRENFLILRLDHFQQNPDLVWSTVCQFINIESTHCLPDISAKNKAGVARSKMVNKLLSGDSFAKRIVKKLLPPNTKRAVGSMVRAINYRAFRDEERPIMNIETKHTLRKKYEADITLLERVTDQSFSEWRL